MELSNYTRSEYNAQKGIGDFLRDKYLSSIIPEQIKITLELTIDFIRTAKYAIFRDGKILNLSIWNLLRWWEFLKLSRDYINQIIKIWSDPVK